jgi:hypothetical protein
MRRFGARHSISAAVLLVGAAHLSEKGGAKQLPTGFKGPADFTVSRRKRQHHGSRADLVQGQLRFIQLRK